MGNLLNIVSFESDVSEKDIQDAKEVNIKIHTFEEVISAGASNSSWSVYQAVADDVYMLSYTSGTTGDPKGVKLRHKMVLQCAQSTNEKLGDTKLNHDDIYISYLPAAHSFE